MITAPKPSVDIKPKTNVLLRRTNIACVVLMELVWVGGVVAGNLLVRRALKQDYAPEV